MKIQNVADFKNELLKALQSNFQCKGMTFTAFMKSLKDTGATDFNKYMHLTPYKSVKDAIKGFFSHIISFSGEDMKLVSVEALANGNEGLLHQFQLELRTESKSKGKGKKIKASGRFEPTYNPPLVTTHLDTYGPVTSDMFGREYQDIDYTPRPLPFVREDDFFYEEDYAPSLLADGLKSESERLILEFIESCNAPPPNPDSEIVKKGGTLAYDVYLHADKIDKADVGEFMGRKRFYSHWSPDYFYEVVVDIHKMLQDHASEPFHKILNMLGRAIFPKPGFDFLDIYNLILAIGTNFFTCSQIILDNMPTLMIECNKQSSEEDLVERIKNLIVYFPLIPDGKYNRRICTAPNYNFPYYILFPTDKIDDMLRNVTHFVPVKQVYPRLLCLVKFGNRLHRALVITSEDFENEGVQVELVDIGAVIRKRDSELYEIREENILVHPRMAVPAAINPTSLEPNLSEPDDLYRRYISARDIPLIITDKGDYVSFEVY